jgi:hypothetical protein
MFRPSANPRKQQRKKAAALQRPNSTTVLQQLAKPKPTPVPAAAAVVTLAQQHLGAAAMVVLALQHSSMPQHPRAAAAVVVVAQQQLSTLQHSRATAQMLPATCTLQERTSMSGRQRNGSQGSLSGTSTTAQAVAARP